MWCSALLLCTGLAFAALLTGSRASEARKGVAGEVRAFVDADGTLHWGGRTFSRVDEPTPISSSRESDVHICKAGESAKAQYGDSETIVKLPRALPIGSVMILSCMQEFGSDAFAGNLQLRCGANVTLEVDIQCGCAPGPAYQPELGLKPISHGKSHQCLTSPSRSVDRKAPRVVWSSRNLDEGAAEIRNCSELLAGANGSWQISCSQGRLCAEGNSCKPPRPVQVSWQKSDLEKAEDLLPQMYSNGTMVRRLNGKVCDSPPQDNWWPIEVCGSLEEVPYSTVAGGYLPGSTQLQLNSPHGLFVSPFNNELYVCDWKNHRIQRWTQASTKVETVAGQTGLTGSFLDTHYLFNPADVMVAGRNKLIPCAEIFIADESNNRILRWPPYAPQGFMVVGYGEAREELNHPTGLFVTPDYHVYIADRLNHRVIVWSQRPGRLQWQYNRTVAGKPRFGKTGPGIGLKALDRPSDVAVSLGGTRRDVFIADFGNNRVVVWTPDAEEGQLVGNCYGPYSVYVNDEGAVFGACRSIHCVKRWENAAGTWLETGTTGDCGFFVTAPEITDPTYPSTINTLFNPSSVFVDIYGNIFVSDTFNARVIKRGRDPLTQWIVSNARATSFTFTYIELRFFTDLDCVEEPTIKHYISAEGVMLNDAPWQPECTQTGTGICEPNVAWIGRQLFGEQAIRCVKLQVDYDTSGGDTFEAAVRYWKGSEYKTLYKFGKLPSGVPTYLRYPRFDTDNPFCVKGQRQCDMNITGDWVADGDKIMIKEDNCKTGIPKHGFPNGGLSLPATKDGTFYQIGDEDTPDNIRADASAAIGGDKANYQICWCDKRINLCQLHQDFSNFVTVLRVDGPFGSQTKITYRGVRLTFTGLSGVNLEPGDRMNVISGGCGISATDVLGVPRPGNSVIARSNPSLTGSDYTWGEDNSANFVTAKPGEYIMCWCRPTLSNCYTLVDYQADAGKLWINGPDRGHTYDCIKGDSCTFTINGFNLFRHDTILILSRCGFEPLTLGFPPFPGGGWFPSLAGTQTGGSNSTYTWGDEGILPVASIYFICWCSGKVFCRAIESYNTEVGTLTVWGPLEINIECALGDNCGVTGVQGLGLEEYSSRAMVIAKNGTCGNVTSRPLTGFPGTPTAISNLATEKGTAFYWGLIKPTAIVPNIYDACWCHKGLPCTDVTDFRAPLGKVSVKGPNRWTESKLCGTGKDCVVTISGLFLTPHDSMVMTKGGCTTGILALAGKTSAQLKSRTDDGLLHIWSADQVPIGGEFVVCWCATNCIGVDRYNVEIGRIIISQPNPNNEVTCLSGSECIITLTGFGLWSTDRVGVVSGDCGSDTAVKGFPNGGTSTETKYVADDMTSAVFVFGAGQGSNGILEAIGGVYTVCWCPARCNEMSDFNILAGQMTVGAPSNIHAYICYNGLPCVVSDLEGLSLSNGDQLRVTSTCSLSSNVAGFPQQGISSGAISTGTQFSWGQQRLSVIVGVYRLCWCANQNDCSNPQSFTTDFGSMIVGGPISGMMRTCESGYDCALEDLGGFNLLAGDKIVLLLICGQGYPIYGWSRGDAWHAWPPFIADPPIDCPGALLGEVCTTFRATEPQMVAEPGDYRMCWCSATSPTCNSAKDFTVDVGLFVNVGAKSKQNFECAAGFQCTVRNMQGTNLEDGDKYRVVLADSELGCATGQIVAGLPNGGVSESATKDGSQVTWKSVFASTTLPRADYSLCWCTYKLPCTSPEHFAMKGGTLAIAGPYANQDRECRLGDVCVVYDIEGVGLGNKDRVLVVIGSCGPDSKPAPKFPNSGLSFDGEDTGATYTFELLVEAVSGRYRMCWCPVSRVLDPTDIVPYSCLHANNSAIHGDFLVDVGELLIPEVPLAGQVRNCVSGVHCQIDNFVGSRGLPLPNSSKILIREPDNMSVLQSRQNPNAFTSTKCLVGSGPAESFPNLAESTPSTLDGTQFNLGTSDESIWTSGGTYIMCWKPVGAETFAYYLGVLIVLGPYSEAGQEFRCTKSAECKLYNVQGEGLGDGDYYRVMAPCAQDASRSDAADQVTVGIPVTRMENSTVRWSAEQFQGAPKFYNLCWCHRSSGCDHPVDFKTTVGDMVIFGPTAGQNKKCDRGQPCDIAGVTGINLQAGDELYILVECKTGPEVPGFSPPTASAIPTSNNQFFYNWPYVTSTPGIFRICWCASVVCAVANYATTMSDYDVEMGIITIQGPANMFWIDAPLIDPPFVDLAPLHAHQWNITLTGVNLQEFPQSQLRIMLVCPTNVTRGVEVDNEIRIGMPTGTRGQKFEFPASSFETIIPATKETLGWKSREYNLCWCRGPTRIESDDCNDVTKFALQFGKLSVFCPKGREPTDTGCKACNLGYFKNIHENVDCTECPAGASEDGTGGLMTTEKTGTVLERFCYCIPGRYYSYPLSCSRCLENHYCLGGLRLWSDLTEAEKSDAERKDIEPHTKPIPCPAHSGAWLPQDCTYDGTLHCAGAFPAGSAMDCSCVPGYESVSQSCTACQVDYFKKYRGNLTTCVLCSSVYPKSSTLEQRAATKCDCEDGLYMEKDVYGNPISCLDCPIGYYCRDSMSFQCPPKKSTTGTGAKSIDDCLCGAGNYENKTLGESCYECADDSIYYKDTIGNQPCDRECPANSKIPVGIFGATGPENCLCFTGYIQTLDLTTLSYKCEYDDYGEADKLRTEVKVTAVVSELELFFYPGDNGEIEVPDTEYIENDEWIKTRLQGALGLSDFSKIILEVQPSWNVYESGRLLTMGSNGSNASIPQEDVAAIVVPVKIIVWQSTVVETKNLKERFEKVSPATTDSWSDTLSNSFDEYKDLANVDIHVDRIRVEFLSRVCPEHSAVLPGQTFVSAEESCKCIPGYEPWWLKPQSEREDAICGVPPDYPNKCVACCTYDSMGKYKDVVSDTRCQVCPKYLSDDPRIAAEDPLNFPATEPLRGAAHSDMCICDAGFYRPDDYKFQCLTCPYGKYCTGNIVKNDCPENEWTKDKGQDNVTDCKCNVGYFRPTVGPKACVGCDPGYYKSTVDDGIGRCTDRCSLLIGTKSTSPPAAIDADACVCQPFSFRKINREKISGYECTACPPEGVDCKGGKENASNESGWFMEHSEPKAQEGWYMLDVYEAKVSECKIQTAGGKSVCTGNSVCAEGHEGFLCGNCMPGYTRNKFPDECRPCSQLPPTSMLMLQTAGEFSAQSLWAMMLAYFALTKTETKKNVMTVLLRMFGHWSSQIGVLQANYNLTKLKPVEKGDEVEEVEEEEEVLPDTGPTTNATTTTPAAPEGFAWPPWYEKMTKQLNFLAEAMNQVGSQQEVVECMIDRLFEMGGEQQRYWRLVGPAAFWLVYPILLSIWTAFLAAIIGFGVIPLIAYMVAPKSNVKKRKQRALRKRKKAALMKRKEERELERQKTSGSLAAENATDRHLNAQMREAEVQDQFEEDSSESSEDSDDDDSNVTGSQKWKGLFHDPPLLPLVDEMDANMVNPCRFTYEYIDKEDDEEQAPSSGHKKHVEYFMMLFRAKPVFGYDFILDIMPWVIIVLNNVWPIVTSRMVELLNCEEFEWSGSDRPEGPVKPAGFLMSHPDTKCGFETEHAVLSAISFSGLATWSFGIVFFFFSLIYMHDLQKPFVTRNFGYLLEGYEPQYWYWELIVKKVDLLVTALITYTSLVTQPQAKILLYSVQASVAFAVQLATGPYDNRQLRLLDRMENVGLFVREVLFTGVAFSLLFAFNKTMTLGLSLVMICLNGYYLGSLFLHMADDFVTTQVAVATEEKVLFRIANRNKLIKKKRKLKQDETVTDAEISAAGIFVKEPVLLFFERVQKIIFFGGGGDTGWRHHQLLRCVWNGPGSDAVLYLPHVYDGWYNQNPTLMQDIGLHFVRMVFGINDERQQDALSECISSFINTLLSLALFDQFPGRLTDLIFFLTRAVKTLKKNMIRYPDAKRPPHPDDPHDEPTNFDDTELLKLALVEELLYSLTSEVRAKRELLADMREGNLRDSLVKENIPIEAAWDVLDKLTNEQLRTAALHPIEIYKRIDFNLILSKATNNVKASMKETLHNHREEMVIRRRIYRFLDYEMREKIEEDPDLNYHDVHSALNALPLVELQRILNSVDALIDVAEYYQKRGNIVEVFKGDVHNILTVEDLNSMLMFIQKLPYKKLHLVIEWTMMLLDYLVLPAKAQWREDLVARGQREKKDPRYYLEHHRLRQKMREESARDAIVERVVEREEEEEEEEDWEDTQMKVVNEPGRVPCPVQRKSFFELEEEKRAMKKEQWELQHRPKDLSHVHQSNITIDLDNLDDNRSAPSMSSFGENDRHEEDVPPAEASETRSVGVGEQFFGGSGRQIGGDSLMDRIDALWRRVTAGGLAEEEDPSSSSAQQQEDMSDDLSGVSPIGSSRTPTPTRSRSPRSRSPKSPRSPARELSLEADVQAESDEEGDMDVDEGGAVTMV